MADQKAVLETSTLIPRPEPPSAIDFNRSQQEVRPNIIDEAPYLVQANGGIAALEDVDAGIQRKGLGVRREEEALDSHHAVACSLANNVVEEVWKGVSA